MKNMAALFCALIMFWGFNSLAQVIVKVNGDKVTISGNFSDLKKGQAVNFLDSSMAVKAKGTIENVSPQGKMAVVQVNSGEVSKDDSFEMESEEKKIENKKSSKAQHLTPEEQEILDRGEIGTTAYVLGGVLGTWPLGFGIGHAIQGRYLEKGWIFTVGEVGSLGLMIAGIQNCTYEYSFYGYWSGACQNNGLLTLGVIGFVGFRIWEIVDLWAAPPEINRRYRALKERTSGTSWSPIIAPTNDTVIYGFQYRF
jgi:hypothetical protein